jgi:hypothetical protein
MRYLLLALAASASAAFAQQHAGGATVFGNMVNSAPPPRGVAVPSGRGGVATAPGRFVPPPVINHPRHPRGSIVAYPVYIGGGYYAPPAYDQGYAPQQQQSAYVPGYGQDDQSPVVIINQNFRPDTANPVMRDYSDVQLPPAQRYDATTTPAVDANGLRDDEPTIFLIAMKDGTIFPAIAYWVIGDTLTYVTKDAKQNHVSLDLVDRPFSKQLNESRRVEFSLPAPKTIDPK